MKNINYQKKYFRVNELNSDTVLLYTNLSMIKKSNVSFLIDALELITMKANKNLVVDISKTDYIDSESGSIIAETVLGLESLGKSVKIVVAKDKPIISYCIGDLVANLDVYLSPKSALKEILN